MPIPLKDNVRTLRLPIVTIVLILVNIGVYVWQVSAPTDHYSSPTLERLGLNQRDERTIDYGAIPYRLLHPGERLRCRRHRGLIRSPGGPGLQGDRRL